MWLHEEILSKMFVNNVENQRQELMKARKRNAELKGKYDNLLLEQSKLNEKLNLNQVQIVTEKNDLNSLQEELRASRKITMELTQRLRIHNENIEMINSCIAETNSLNYNSLMELEPIQEILGFKTNVVECLEKKLIESRLNSAEQDEIITELQRNVASLDNELETLKNIKPGTVSKWQQEFLDAKIRESDVILEFDKIKRTVSMLKEEIQEKIEETGKEIDDASGDFFKLKLNMRDKYHEELKQEEKQCISNTIELQDEVDYLKMKIKRFEKRKKGIEDQIYENEENKVDLHAERTNMYYRYNKIMDQLQSEKEKYKTLEETSNRELDKILKSITDKIVEIAHLNKRIHEIEFSNLKNSKISLDTQKENDEETTKHLNEEISQLEEQIEGLSSP